MLARYETVRFLQLPYKSRTFNFLSINLQSSNPRHERESRASHRLPFIAAIAPRTEPKMMED